MTFSDETKEALAAFLDRAKTGGLVVHVPLVANPYVPHRGMHFHAVPEVSIQLSGTSVMEFSDCEVRCRPDEMLVIPRGAAHVERVAAAKTGFRNMVIMFGQQTISIHEAVEGKARRPRIMKFHHIAVPDPGRIYVLLDELINTAHSGSTRSADGVSGLATAFLAAMLDAHDQHPELQRKESFKTAQCRRLTTEHISDPDLNVRRLAELIRCSPDYLSNLFHRETGTRLTDHINAKRIAFARSLLENSALNISEIAQACGYNGAGYLTRQFRRRTGKTPREFRRTLRRP
jgi:AraC-like DNA-binding protein